MTQLNIENLAKAIHEDEWKAATVVYGFTGHHPVESVNFVTAKYDECSEEFKNVRREQARLMFERIMR